MSLTVVIADDHRVVRTGLRLLLETDAGFEVLAEADDVASARHYVRAHRPQVLVLDLNMPGGSSLAAIPALREEVPETQIVVLTMQDDPAFAREALKAGALGFVLKRAAETELIEAVRLAARGEAYLNPQLGARIVVEPPPGTLTVVWPLISTSWVMLPSAHLARNEKVQRCCLKSTCIPRSSPWYSLLVSISSKPATTVPTGIAPPVAVEVN